MPAQILLLGQAGPERDRLEEILRLLGVPLRAVTGLAGPLPEAELVVVGGTDLEAVVSGCARVRAEAPEPGLLACLLSPPVWEGGQATRHVLAAGADDLLLGLPPEGVVLGRVLTCTRLARLRQKERRAAALQRALRQIVERVGSCTASPSLAGMSDGVPMLEGPDPRAALRLFSEVLGMAVRAVGWDHGALVRGGEDESLLLVATSVDGERGLVPLRAAEHPALMHALRAGERASLSGAVERGRLATTALLPQDGVLLGLPLRGGAVGADQGSSFLLLLHSAAAGARLDAEGEAFLCTAAQVTFLALRGQGVIESLRDQTRRIHLGHHPAERRQEALAQYREFFESSADGMIVVDNRGHVQYLSRIAEQITGYAAAGLVGRSLLELVPETQRAGLLDAIQQVLQHVTLHAFDLQLTSTSGERLILSVSTSSVLAEHGCALLSFRDVTEQRILEHELRKTKDFLERLIDAVVDGIIAADMRGNILLFNRGAARLTGYQPEEVIGRLPVWRLYPEGEAHDIMAQLRSPEHGGVGRLQQSRRTLIGKGGIRVPVSLTAAIVYDQGQEVATVGVVSDLRERLHIEERLHQTEERLALSEKQALIAELAGAAAHELNQPLTSVMGYAGLLRRKLAQTGPELVELADILVREAERMAEIVRKIGHITRYETKAYVGQARILDLDRSAEAPPAVSAGKEGR